MSNPYDKAVTNSSVLGPTLKFKGELTANEDLLIQGQIEGSITHSSNLTIGKEGKLKADVNAEYIAVEGKVEGNLSGSKSVVVKEGADVNGNINSPIVTLREGAVFNGKIDMSGDQEAKANAPQQDAEAKSDSDSKPATRQKRSADAA